MVKLWMHHYRSIGFIRTTLITWADQVIFIQTMRGRGSFRLHERAAISVQRLYSQYSRTWFSIFTDETALFKLST